MTRRRKAPGQSRTRRSFSAWVLRTRLALVRSWTSWEASSLRRRQPRQERKLALLQEATDRQLLLLKETQLRLEMLEHRQQELEGSRQFHRQTEPPPQELLPQELLPPQPMPPQFRR